jgi:hypothetical protein
VPPELELPEPPELPPQAARAVALMIATPAAMAPYLGRRGLMRLIIACSLHLLD